MIIKHDFNVHFVPKQTNKKFLIFDQNHGLTPLKKSQYGNSVKIHCYSLGGLLFLTRSSWDIISGLILLQKKTKTASMWNPYLYSLEGLVSTSMIIKTLFPGPFCPETNKDKISIFWPKSWVKPFEQIPIW